MATRVRIEPSAVELQYRLVPRWWQGGAAALVLAILYFSERGVWRFIVAVVLLAIVGVYMLAWLIPQRVRVTAEFLILPKSRWSTAEVFLPFRSLQIPRGGKAGSVFIELREGFEGPTYTVWSSMFQSDGSFEELCWAIRQHVDDANRVEART